MILFIDTTDFKTMRFALIGIDVSNHIFEIAYNENWKTLDYLQRFLKQTKTTLKAIDKIVVCSGPGSFTGTRVGVTIAEGLALANHIPVMAINKNQVPKDLKKLKTLKAGKKIEIEYLPSKFD